MSPAAGIDHSSLAAAQERVAQVQQRIALLSGQGLQARSAAPASGSTSATFADALSLASQQLAGTGDALPTDSGAAAGGASALGGALLRPAALRSSSSTGAAAYQQLFDAATAKHGLPAGLLSAVAEVESGYDPTAVSPAGARGLMQIMPGTARDLGVDPMVPAQAVDGAARLLSQNLESFGSLSLALAAYNAGPGNVRKHGGIPPFAETQAYVKKVTAAAGKA